MSSVGGPSDRAPCLPRDLTDVDVQVPPVLDQRLPGANDVTDIGGACSVDDPRGDVSGRTGVETLEVDDDKVRRAPRSNDAWKPERFGAVARGCA